MWADVFLNIKLYTNRILLFLFSSKLPFTNVYFSLQNDLNVFNRVLIGWTIQILHQVSLKPILYIYYLNMRSIVMHKNISGSIWLLIELWFHVYLQNVCLSCYLNTTWNSLSAYNFIINNLTAKSLLPFISLNGTLIIDLSAMSVESNTLFVGEKNCRRNLFVYCLPSYISLFNVFFFLQEMLEICFST